MRRQCSASASKKMVPRPNVRVHARAHEQITRMHTRTHARTHAHMHAIEGECETASDMLDKKQAVDLSWMSKSRAKLNALLPMARRSDVADCRCNQDSMKDDGISKKK